jgi:RNA polymerase sigma factor (sigma-70 family)
MSHLSEADRYLLEQIKQGNPDGWSQLVQRYQGRLVAFARRELANAADAEDAAQETFLSFLTGLGGFRGQASLETYLFAIIRRRIVDQIRTRGRDARVNLCSLQDSLPSAARERQRMLESQLPAGDPSASWYARRQEDHALLQQALWDALRTIIDRLKQMLNFRDLQICDLVFYAQLRNKDIASLMEMDEKHVALVKHRFIRRISDEVQATQQHWLQSGEQSLDETLLTQLWEANRPSCPKRSTIGKYLLGTLDAPWRDYVDFHIHKLGCRFCLANRDDLDAETKAPQPRAACQRIIQSTIGFLRR